MASKFDRRRPRKSIKFGQTKLVIASFELGGPSAAALLGGAAACSAPAKSRGQQPANDSPQLRAFVVISYLYS